MKAYLIYALFLLPALFVLNSCEIIDPAEPVPAYLYVEPFEFTTVGDQGSNSSKITEGWVYVAGDFLGAYTLPALLPVLQTGEQQVEIFPGIKDNGISATPDIYTLYKRYTTTIDLGANEVDTVYPSTRYEDNVFFRIIESFESDQHFFQGEIDGNELTQIVSSDVEVFEGTGSGQISLDKENPLATMGSFIFDELPPAGATVYIEMDYKNDVPLLVGVYGYDRFGVELVRFVDRGVNPRDDWNKIYFNLRDPFFTMRNAGVERYQVVLVTSIPIENGDFSMDNAEVYIDNVKLVYLQ
ncbi:MAG: hypothetical protein AAFP19_15295 [Bacteroidota bacterium]